ncbi:MAG: SDR family NAD(P)-dependent oxidoreductase [Sporichthyaceae bacterium]
MTDLSGRVVVVTGGNNGLGLGLAAGVARAGADVAIWSRNQERNEAAAKELAEHGRRVLPVRCDVGSEDDVAAAMERTVAELGALDALFANAGVHDAAPYVDTSMEDWHRVLRTNIDGTFLTTREAARRFTTQGTGGSLVVVSSTIIRYGATGQAAYAASKCAIAGLGRVLAVELARHRVRVNILIPGWTRTGMNQGLRTDDRFLAATTARTPVRRWADPAEFEDVAAYLADPTITFHTGNEVVVDGGYTIF